jgi:hypothetical protein
MALYEVTYSVGNRGPSGNGAFVTESGMSYLTMTVEAPSPSHAQRIVENMFGGYEHCQASPGRPVW